jgi:hypothetical protein
VYNSNLAICLDNLSLRLSDLGHEQDALEVIKESVELRRGLAKKLPTAYNPGLVSSLIILSNCLKGLGREEDARYVTEEANRLKI